MGRTIGANNKKSTLDRLYTNMTVDERLSFLANLITDKIRDDQKNGYKLYSRLNRGGNESAIATS